MAAKVSKEFMLYIRNAGDAKAALSSDEHLAFVKQCEVYIGRLQSQGKLVAAQPIIREGFVLSKSLDGWSKVAIDPTKEVQVGYYHIMVDNMDEAIEIAKQNPEFEYVPSARIEIHQIKTKEDKTDYVYPNK